MSSDEMYILFTELLDKATTQSSPEIYPEQAFQYINIAVNEVEQAGRVLFEKDAKVSEDLSVLVKRGIAPAILETTDVDSYVMPFSSVLDVISTQLLNPAYFITGYTRTTLLGTLPITGTTELERVQQDDIRPLLKDPFAKPMFANKVPYVVENAGLRIYSNPKLRVDSVIGTYMTTSPLISNAQSCILPNHLHISLVKRAVEIALDVIESPRVATFPKIDN